MTGADHRPWLILSRKEAIALQTAALRTCQCERPPKVLPEALVRALRQVDLQLRYIEGALDGEEPTPNAAVERDMSNHG